MNRFDACFETIILASSEAGDAALWEVRGIMLNHEHFNGRRRLTTPAGIVIAQGDAVLTLQANDLNAKEPLLPTCLNFAKPGTEPIGLTLQRDGPSDDGSEGFIITSNSAEQRRAGDPNVLSLIGLGLLGQFDASTRSGFYSVVENTSSSNPKWAAYWQGSFQVPALSLS